MSDILKKGLALCAVSLLVFGAVVAADNNNEAVIGFGNDEEKVERTYAESATKSYGWSVIALGLATPVQLPWGMDKWDIFGLDFNLGYSDAPKMYGLEIAAGANVARKTFMGLQTAVGFNYSNTNAYGMAVSLFNMNNYEFYGISVDAAGMNRNVYGLEVNFLGSLIEDTLGGAGISGVGNLVGGDMYGFQASLAANFARRVHGCQAAVVYNQTDLLWGCQLGLVNMANECDHGFQIGLVNVIMDNQVPFLPIVNGYF